ncbi:MAG: hypothetical protein M0012_06190 [Deltaproteobacteria bacterium]|nr:hypothetical protein [Deltaproteobacteria bacterium]
MSLACLLLLYPEIADRKLFSGLPLRHLQHASKTCFNKRRQKMAGKFQRNFTRPKVESEALIQCS